MKLLNCPHLGARPENEFTYGGEVRVQPDPDTSSDAQWADYVFNRQGRPGTHHEWWYHNPTGIWFIAERDTITDRFLRIELASPERLKEAGHG
ncbi:MAG: sarcosine oxidase subunit delta [Gammaproteobacteria bacterium]|nr:sarcosine oxidase subunit delta [Gammaproteobacteria bacterium]